MKHLIRGTKKRGIASVAGLVALLFLPNSEAASPRFEWADTGSLAHPRSEHSGTLLLNGQVLVAGGIGRKGVDEPVLHSVELYDPATGNWSITGRLTDARYAHTATVLLDGKVLVTGGVASDYRTQLTSAELYDPDSGQFTMTASMNTRRTSHVAVRLLDGRVLVAGGYDGREFLTSAEIYDPSTGTWTFTGNMNVARTGLGVLLHSGQVLIMGGTSLADYQTAELYDPETGVWTLTGSMVDSRSSGYTATRLRDGRVLVTGGIGTRGWLKSCELYDPATGSWRRTGEMRMTRILHQAVLLPGGHVLVTGGQSNEQGGLSFPTLTQTYNPKSGRWMNSGRLIDGRFLHSTNPLPGGEVLVAGGASQLARGVIVRGCELGTPVTSSTEP